MQMTVDTRPPNHPAPLVWTEPSCDSSGSMPLGNGDIGLNVWVEQDGDLLFYLGKTDAWDVEFKLHAPGRTVVEGSYCKGKLAALTVSPASRGDDVNINRKDRTHERQD